ncbi:hypothetical protein GBAR_LOCUS6156, partial [Geodia barretti]
MRYSPSDVVTTAVWERAVFIGGYFSTHFLCRSVYSMLVRRYPSYPPTAV